MAILDGQVPETIPDSGFVHDYWQFARTLTDAPEIYHVAVGLAMLAATIPPNVGMPYHGTVLHPTTWILIIGPSGDRKTHAMHIGRRIMEEAIPTAIAETPLSAEGQMKSLSKQPQQSVWFDEFGDHLARTKLSYAAPLRDLQTDLASNPKSKELIGATKRYHVTNPRLSIFGAVNLAMLAMHTSFNDFQGGYLSRFLMLASQRQRFCAEPATSAEEETAARDELVSRLQWLRDQPMGVCAGFTPSARELWVDWSQRVDKVKSEQSDENMIGALARVDLQAARIAMVLGSEMGSARSGEPWYISAKALEPAIMLAEMGMESAMSTCIEVAPTEYARLYQSARNVLARRASTFGDILASITPKAQPYMVRRVLESMLAEGVVDVDAAGGVETYRWR